ncbi:hypothetical protein CEXT_171141 [Caerostris extrusa]|uniref:Uncharacterized protein n=1 Tax=Caerostris extrusa TaxID=172846 RepID=A0AAV4NTF7_CAEEX|nr:hypothetical protein CEXT_171141 [Caerostris extrusa]
MQNILQRTVHSNSCLAKERFLARQPCIAHPPSTEDPTSHMAKDHPYSWSAEFSAPVWTNSHLQIDKSNLQISECTTFLPRNLSSKKVKRNPEDDGTEHYDLFDEIASINSAFPGTPLPNTTVSHPKRNYYTGASFVEDTKFLGDGNVPVFQSNQSESRALILDQKGGYISDQSVSSNRSSSFSSGECSTVFDSDKSRPSPESSFEARSTEVGAMGLRPYNNPAAIDNYPQENVNYYDNPYSINNYMNSGNSVTVQNHLSQPPALLKKSKHSSRKKPARAVFGSKEPGERQGTPADQADEHRFYSPEEGHPLPALGQVEQKADPGVGPAVHHLPAGAACGGL